MRSWVPCGIDFAAGERLMTRDTVAGESPRCSARNFRLTDGAVTAPRGREDATIFDRGMGAYGRVVWHNRVAAASGNANFSQRVERSRGDSSPTSTRHIDLSRES